ncbi:hypothetical protein DPMN_141987 [Dreissena polymorpha]|uniref:Uncharacterized protein n=1 Tax=Dreissena polymorpha TaxID=45954 RepID=A0A9D4GAB2_DREPO|nr:hypothetical protein DPMN_141987 [Dreissena polymorpha]
MSFGAHVNILGKKHFRARGNIQEGFYFSEGARMGRYATSSWADHEETVSIDAASSISTGIVKPTEA